MDDDDDDDDEEEEGSEKVEFVLETETSLWCTDSCFFRSCDEVSTESNDSLTSNGHSKGLFKRLIMLLLPVIEPTIGSTEELMTTFSTPDENKNKVSQLLPLTVFEVNVSGKKLIFDGEEKELALMALV